MFGLAGRSCFSQARSRSIFEVCNIFSIRPYCSSSSLVAMTNTSWPSSIYYSRQVSKCKNIHLQTLLHKFLIRLFHYGHFLPIQPCTFGKYPISLKAPYSIYILHYLPLTFLEPFRSFALLNRFPFHLFYNYIDLPSD